MADQTTGTTEQAVTAPSVATILGKAAAPATPAPETSAPTSSPAATPALDASKVPDWAKGIEEKQQALVVNKKWGSVGDVLTSYSNLETLVGKKGQGAVSIPTAESTPEERSEFWSKLGVPKTAEEYGIKAPDGVAADAGLIALAPKLFHGANLTKDQAAAFVGLWNESQATAAKDAEAAKISALQDGVNAISKEWGAAYEEKEGVVAATVRALGKYMTEESLTKIRDAMGVPWTMNFLHDLGAGHGLGPGLGEGSLVKPESASEGFGQLKPSEAAARIEELKNDAQWQKERIAGDVAKESQWKRLLKMKHGERG